MTSPSKSAINEQLSLEQTARGRAQFLSEASRLLATSFDPAVMLASLARLAVPALADFCHVDLRDDNDVFSRVSVAHVDPALEALLRGYVLKPDVFSADHPTRRAMEFGESALVSDVTTERVEHSVLEAGRREMMLKLAIRTAVVVPLRIDSRIVGVIIMATSVSGRTLGADDLTLVEDLASRASLAIENARLFREAQDAVAARDEVLAIVAHDLRNPLNNIMLASELMQEQVPAGRPEVRTLGMILKSAHTMNRLIADLLEVKRVETGSLLIQARAMALPPIIEEAIEMLQPMSSAASVRLTHEFEPGLSLVMADGVRVQQVLSNLVGNAIKFTPANGHITVRAFSKASGYVQISVVDDGPGIARDQLTQVFGRFWQGGHRDRLGVGLGLAICKDIIEAHGGEIWVESTLGEESAFNFSLPCAPGAPSESSRSQP